MHLLSSAVLETRMVFPGDESSSTSVLPSSNVLPAAAESAPSSSSTTLAPSATTTAPITTTHDLSISTRVFTALQQAGKDGADMLRMAGAVSSQGMSSGTSGVCGSRDKEGGSPGVQVFVMEKDHLTVEALWREYDVGLYGRLPLRQMLAQDLKKAECQRKRWERRRVVIKEVERLAKERITTEEGVARDLDKYMPREKLSMSKLQDQINVARKTGNTVLIWTSE
ncbi:hypothetical protein QFC22_006089 [Naganishia vaughanmartiniae]|uniref:Uncharacterized protein n=1 Tax=Naganishia vaughanmartiniae TaxID=1424756 RepID=A0ACC2WPZ3_9TREE|nr:hypothetical protein QFC22_006089 [Naganishia vaughanmartiniae]